MKDKLNQFISNINGQFIEVSDKSNIYQCMDLAYLWTFCLGFPKATIQRLYAYEVYTKPTDLTKQYFDLIPNSPDFIPQDGDITVFDKTTSNIAGHIGIALGGGTTKSFLNFEQNYPLGTNANIHTRDYNTPKLLGVLRPKIKDVITDQTLLPIVDENGNQYEVQAVRSRLLDWGNQIVNLKLSVNALNDQITALQTKLDAIPLYVPDAVLNRIHGVIWNRGWPWAKIKAIKVLLP